MIIADRKKIVLVIALLIIACLAAFSRVAGNDFINFDDPGCITQNYNVQSGFNLQNIKWASTAVVSGNWHPLTMISHTLDWSLFKDNAGGHHLVSLLLHIGAVIFLFLFLNKTTNSLWPSAFAVALFALHPLRVESVAWASERKDVLSMFFGMASIYAYAFYAESSKLSRYLLCLILFILALMSKPMLVTLPFLLLLLDYWPLGRWQRALSAPTEGRFKLAGRLVWEKVPFICLTIASSIITFWAQNKENSVASVYSLPFLKRAVNATFSYTAYLDKIFRPVNLGVYYPYDFFLPLWKFLISGIILILITAAVLYYIKKLPFLFTGWFWYLGGLIPVIGLVQVGSQAMADRYTYLPSIGIAIMLAWGIPLFFQREDVRKKILFPAAIAILFILAILTWTQCGYWKNSITLFSRVLQVTKDNYIAHNHLASALHKRRFFERAIYHYNEAIRLNPVYAHAYYNRGITYYTLGQKQRALDDFKETIRIIPKSPDSASAYNNLGVTYTDLGQYQLAIDNYNEATRLKPDYTDAYNNRAIVYLNQGNSVSGCSDAQKACELGNCAALKDARSKELCR
ncbi:MAG: tetratricopeptide repeat protein [Deltaproteobacteria bacterium]|nr:tetratricopeptide repeat protein [Deltaproteobacteria bacterium]